MQPHELETWVLKIVDRVKAKQPVEDSRVELKSEWPGPNDAARRIAGLANASHGAPALWIVGIDEKANQIVGADEQNLANWWPQVVSEFESGFAPDKQDLAIPTDGVTVVALLFQTDRRPFVVKNAQQGRVQFEVPWRDATGIRTARRRELITLLSPLVAIPHLQVLDGSLVCNVTGSGPIVAPKRPLCATRKFTVKTGVSHCGIGGCCLFLFSQATQVPRVNSPRRATQVPSLSWNTTRTALCG
jgi:hypothetical protein